jgi:hypothetical protein
MDGSAAVALPKASRDSLSAHRLPPVDAAASRMGGIQAHSTNGEHPGSAPASQRMRALPTGLHLRHARRGKHIVAAAHEVASRAKHHPGLLQAGPQGTKPGCGSKPIRGFMHANESEERSCSSRGIPRSVREHGDAVRPWCKPAANVRSLGTWRTFAAARNAGPAIRRPSTRRRGIPSHEEQVASLPLLRYSATGHRQIRGGAGIPSALAPLALSSNR